MFTMVRRNALWVISRKGTFTDHIVDPDDGAVLCFPKEEGAHIFSA
jgi:hypothetical protein